MGISQVSILISSSEPAKLSKFYSLVMNSSYCKGLNENHYEIKSKTCLPLTFFKPSTKRMGTNPQQHSLSISFQRKPSSDPLNEINNWLFEIISFGGSLIEGPRLEFFGAEAWISDLDGNPFLIFVPLEED